jgi:lysine N6-hydroxylase
MTPAYQRPQDGGPFRLIGIGAGPANLSLAAFLNTSHGRTRDAFFDARTRFAWHPGMMLPDAEMQIHWLKDLVTPVDPTNPYSFLAFTVSRGEFYRLLNTRRRRVSRREFEAYCAWVADRLPTVRFGTEVLDMRWSDGFLVRTSAGTYRSTHVCVAVGVQPLLPECAHGADSRLVTHSANYAFAPLPETARRVAVVGGGQSGAEVVAHLLQQASPNLQEILWMSRRSTYLPLDESPFVEEFFTPAASDTFFQQSADIRRQVLAELRMASDGISDSLLESIYNRLYDIDNGYVQGPSLVLSPATELVDLRTQDNQTVQLELRRCRTGHRSRWTADYVVLATGYEQALPPVLRSIADRFDYEDGGLRIRPDFSVVWDGPDTNRIFVQNAARHKRGIADPNLSLVAWRAANIALRVAPDLGERLLDPYLDVNLPDDWHWSELPGQGPDDRGPVRPASLIVTPVDG